MKYVVLQPLPLATPDSQDRIITYQPGDVINVAALPRELVEALVAEGAIRPAG